jgi:PAS domain S-box-containing protein
MPMAPSAALSFVLLGLSLYFRSRFPSSRWTYLMGMALGSLTALAAILLLALPAATIDNSIEHLGMSISGTRNGVPLGQMSPLTALSCAFIALSFLGTLSSSPERRGRAVAAFALTCILTLVSTALLLGYLLGIPLLYGGEFVPPALPSSLCSLFLAVAVVILAGLQVWPSGTTDEPKAARPSYAAALIFVLLSSGILVVGYVYHRNFERQYRAEIENVLASITDLKVSELTHWREERLAGAAQFYRNTTFSGLAERSLRIPEDVDARSSILAWFRQVREANRYDRISLYDASLVERLSSPNGLELADSLFLRHAAIAMRSHEVVFQDFYRDEHTDRVFLNILIPVVNARNSNRIIGMIAMRIDPDKYIYPLLKRWPTPSRTAETLLIRKEGNAALYLNRLRFNNDAALKLRIPLDSTNVPAVKAALGLSGIVEGTDYRGVAVIADVHAVPDSPWSLVARIDLSEVYAPLHERSRITILLMCVMFIGAASGLALLRRRQNVRFYKDQYLAEHERTWLHDVIARSINEIYVIEPQTLRFKFANAGAQRNIGYTAGELTELTPVDIAPEYTEKTFRAMLRPLFTGEKSLLVIETLHRRKDGSRYPVESHLQLVERPEGNVCLVIVTDITERKQAEEELRASEERFRIVTESTTDVIYEWDLKESITWFGDVDGVLGYPAGIFPRTLGGWVAALHPGDKERVWMAVEEQLKGAAPYDVEYRIQGKYGVWYWWSARGTVIKNERGESGRWIGAVTDVTERKRADLELREREARYRTLVENIPQKILMKDRNFRWVSINENLARDFGFRPEEVVGKMDADLFTPELAAKYHSDDVRIMETGEAEEFEEKYIVAGKETWVNTIKTPIRGEKGEIEGVLGVFWDITGRKQAESELRRYVNQLSVINRLDHVISSTFDIGEVYDTLVLDMRQLFQFDRTSLSTLNEERTEWQIVKQWTSGEPGLMPKVWRKVEGSVVEWLILNKRSFVEERIGEQGTWPENELLTKEGIASRVAVPLIVRGKVIGAMTLASKNPEAYKKGDVEMLESLADQVGISMHNAMMYNKVGEHAATLEKRVKERTGQLETANKELEAFSYSVSHDLRAPLRSIDGFSKIMMEEYSNKLDAEGKRILNVIRSNTQKMGELITDLLDLSRVTRDEMKTVRVDMTTLANSVFREIASPDAQKQYAFSIEALPDAYGDPSLLRQVWRNLISNAIKFTATKDVRHIEIGARSEDGMTVYFIRDSGVGFDPQYTHKLFGVFQRLHTTEAFEGTGVGLAIVQRIVHRHGGRVWAEGRIGEGATFYFALPSKGE